MTPAELAAAQARLGLSDRLFGEAIGWSGDPGRTTRRLKAGDRGIQETVAHRVRQLLRAHDRAALPSRWIFGAGEAGEPEYIVHLEDPGFIATVGDALDGKIEVENIRVATWLGDPPLEMSDVVALMREAADALEMSYTLALMREAAAALNAHTAQNDE